MAFLESMQIRRAARLFAFALAVAAGGIPAAEAAAQEPGSITGTVTDAGTQAPVDGAQVSVEGTSRGALTNRTGRYLITDLTPGTYTVRIVHIGMRSTSQEVAVSAGEPAVVDFSLEISAVSLDEVVVTGTAGAVERRKLGNSLASIDVAEIEESVPLETFSQTLEARIPGVRSVGTAGGVGAGRSLRIRGTGSFELGQRPVVYIDGVRVDTDTDEWGMMASATCCSFSGGAGEDRLSDLNPAEIERIEVLKGAAAATLYGSDASNGVIQIFTKRGRSNSAPQFTFATSMGFNRQRENFPTKLNPNFTGPDGFRALDANKTLIENGLVNSYDLTAQGGGADITYFVSGGFAFEEGSVKPNHQKRGNLRLNLNWTANEKWTVGINSAFSRNQIWSLQSGNNWMSLLGNATNGSPKTATEERPYGEAWIPVSNIQQVKTLSDANRWTGGINIAFTPSPNFSHRLNFGLDNVDDQKSRVLPFGFFYTYAGEAGERNLGYRTSRTFTADYLGNMKFGFSDAVRSDFSFGAQGFWEKEFQNMATGRAYAGPGVTTVGGGAETFGDELFREAIQVGVFAQNRFEFFDKLFATVGLRVDGNSAFGVNYGLQPYPKADISYNMSAAEDAFLPSWLSSLKLRGAWGMAGKSPGAYDQFQTFDATAVLDDRPGVTPANPGNPDLEPEKTTEIEAGFDAGLFNDRVGLSVTGYHAITRDALLEIDLPSSEGFDDPQLQNAGKIQNQGIEVQLNTTPVNTPSLRWQTTVNMDWSDNEILDLGPNAIDGILGDHREGHAVESHWDRAICKKDISCDVEGYDPSTNTHARTDTAVYQGDPLPHWNASWSNTVTFGPFRVYGQVRGEWGATFPNGDRPYRIRQGGGDEYLSTLDAAGEPTAKTDSLVDYYTLVSAFDSRDHIRIQEVSLTYSLPEQFSGRFGLGRTTLTLSGYNLYWWDDCHCMDPSMQYVSGSSFNFSGFLAMPQPRRFLVSVRTSF